MTRHRATWSEAMAEPVGPPLPESPDATPQRDP